MVFNQFLTLSFLQLKRIKRSFENLGIFRFLFVVAIIVGTVFAVFTFLYNGEGLHIAASVFLLLIVSLQIQRKDTTFLDINFNHYRIILFYQYLLLSLPLLCFLLFHSEWVLLLASISGIIIVPIINFKFKNNKLNTKIQQWIPADAFEWKAGMRKFLFLIIAV